MELAKEKTIITNGEDWSYHIAKVFFKYKFSEEDIRKAFDTLFEELSENVLKEILDVNLQCAF